MPNDTDTLQEELTRERAEHEGTRVRLAGAERHSDFLQTEMTRLIAERDEAELRRQGTEEIAHRLAASDPVEPKAVRKEIEQRSVELAKEHLAIIVADAEKHVELVAEAAADVRDEVIRKAEARVQAHKDAHGVKK